MAREAYADVRESVLGLRMTSAPGNGWVSSVQEHVHKFTLQTGIHVHFDSNGADHCECSQEVQLQMLRIIHEALSNVRKHSEVRQARVSIEHQGERIQVCDRRPRKGF